MRAGIGLVPQERGVIAGQTIDASLWLGAIGLGLTATVVAVRRDETFARFSGLGERCAQSAGTPGGGERQRLALAKVLIRRPKLILLDERAYLLEGGRSAASGGPREIIHREHLIESHVGRPVSEPAARRPNRPPWLASPRDGLSTAGRSETVGPMTCPATTCRAGAAPPAFPKREPKP